MDSFTIRVQTLQPATYEVSVTPTTSVAALKQVIAPLVGVSAHRQRLIWKGRVMNDPQTLSDLGIRSGDAVHLVEPAEAASQPAATADPAADLLRQMMGMMTAVPSPQQQPLALRTSAPRVPAPSAPQLPPPLLRGLHDLLQRLQGGVPLPATAATLPHAGPLAVATHWRDHQLALTAAVQQVLSGEAPADAATALAGLELLGVQPAGQATPGTSEPPAYPHCQLAVAAVLALLRRSSAYLGDTLVPSLAACAAHRAPTAAQLRLVSASLCAVGTLVSELARALAAAARAVEGDPDDLVYALASPQDTAAAMAAAAPSAAQAAAPRGLGGGLAKSGPVLPSKRKTPVPQQAGGGSGSGSADAAGPSGGAGSEGAAGDGSESATPKRTLSRLPTPAPLRYPSSSGKSTPRSSFTGATPLPNIVDETSEDGSAAATAGTVGAAGAASKSAVPPMPPRPRPQQQAGGEQPDFGQLMQMMGGILGGGPGGGVAGGAGGPGTRAVGQQAGGAPGGGDLGGLLQTMMGGGGPGAGGGGMGGLFQMATQIASDPAMQPMLNSMAGAVLGGGGGGGGSTGGNPLGALLGGLLGGLPPAGFGAAGARGGGGAVVASLDSLEQELPPGVAAEWRRVIEADERVQAGLGGGERALSDVYMAGTPMQRQQGLLGS